MRVLVTGATGMLGASLSVALQEKYEVFASGGGPFPDHPFRAFRAFDLAAHSYRDLIDWARPDAIIHAGALTSVDYCEDHEQEALAVNATSVRRFLEQSDARVIFISSDAVFGEKSGPVDERYGVDPVNVYGQSKAAGERAILEKGGRNHCAVRTTIVGANLNGRKRSFAEWIVGTILSGGSVDLFTDAVFTPISTTALIRRLAWILERDVHGLLHVAGGEPISKFDFGVKLVRALGVDTANVRPARLEAARLRARRIYDQSLDSSSFARASGLSAPPIDETIADLTALFRDKVPSKESR